MKNIQKIILIIIILLNINFIYANSNGIWQNAEDLRGGIIGQDEQQDTTYYKFINNVYFELPLLLKKIQVFNTQGIEFTTNDGISRLKITNNGNIGIGISEPNEKLEVNGKIIMHTETQDIDGNKTVVTKGYLNKKITETSSSSIPKIRVYDTVGNYNWNKPNNLKYIKVYVTGGGAGGNSLTGGGVSGGAGGTAVGGDLNLYGAGGDEGGRGMDPVGFGGSGGSSFWGGGVPGVAGNVYSGSQLVGKDAQGYGAGGSGGTGAPTGGNGHSGVIIIEEYY